MVPWLSAMAPSATCSMRRDANPLLPEEGQRFQDEQVERAVGDVRTGRHV